MLSVKRENTGSTLVLRLSGDVVEDVDLDTAVGQTAPNTVLNCKEISRLNSMGVKRWIMYFESQRQKGAAFRFQECSPAVVEQLNLIRNFSCGGTIESIYVPFVCTSCKKSLVGLFKTDDLRRANLTLPDVKCNRCGSPAEFDDLAEEYFRFISR